MEAQSTPVTTFHLEMLSPSEFSPKVAPPELEIERIDPPNPQLNRKFYYEVGAMWNWTDRLVWSDDDWQRYVDRDALGTWIGRFNDDAVGYFELEAQADGSVEIVYFGLLPAFIGRGLGASLLSKAIECAWNLPDTCRVWVHTCTDDHDHALDNYRKRGFKIFKTECSSK